MNKNKLARSNRNYIELQRILFFGILLLLTFSCNTYKKDTIVEKSIPIIKLTINTDTIIKQSRSIVTLIINTDTLIENIVFTKFGGFTKEDLIPFQDTVIVTLNESINDMYQLLCESRGKFLENQLWLNGEDIVIKGNIKNGALLIDTVINSPFYYYSTQVMTNFEAMIKKKVGNKKINNFLLKEIEQNIDHPFSNILASEYINYNIDQPKNLKQLQAILESQNWQIKSHILNVHDTFNSLINTVTIKFSNFKFLNSDGQENNISIERDAFYLLDFWATYCLPCIADHKIIKTKLAAFEEAGINVVGISTDYHQSKWMDFMKSQQYKWANYIELNGDENSLSKYVGLSMNPTYLVINGNGKILNRNHSIEKSITFLKESKILK